MQIQVGIWLRTVWAWTFGGLPGWLTLPGFLQQWSRPICVNSLPLTRADIQRGEVLDLILGPKLFLQKELTFPARARANLARVIDLQMRQSLPNGGADLIWRYAVEGRSKSEIKVSVFLLKKRVLEELKGSVSRQKAKLRIIKIENYPSVEPFWDNRQKIDWFCRFWGAIALMLFFAIIVYVGWQEARGTAALKQQVTQLEQDKSELSTKAVALKMRLDAENMNFAVISHDVGLFQAEFQRLPILLELTEVLPDDTWISELVLTGSNLHLSGFTERDVTEVMATLRDLPWVLRVALNGPVSFDSFSRRNRFDLSIIMQTDRGVRP